MNLNTISFALVVVVGKANKTKHPTKKGGEKKRKKGTRWKDPTRV
jgi:hypothetical protein